MPATSSKLDRPALAVIARIARRQLRAADEAWERLSRGHDAEALHAFRVALRRLRSTLQAYRPQLDGIVRPKDRHRLRRLADATGPARDAEVQLARLRELRAELGADARAATAPLVRRLRRLMRDGYATANDTIAARYPRMARALDRRLRRVEIPSDAPPFGMVLGRFIAMHTGGLRPLLEHVPAPDATRALHQARIEAKRLRYVLEPVRRDLPGSTVLVHRLERVQDLLGEVHDFQVLERTLATARAHGLSARTLLTLTRSIRVRQRRAYTEVSRSVAGAHAEAVLGPLDLLTARLGAVRRPTLPVRRTSEAAPLAVVSARRW
jgi:CHAD domain-containing protein